MLLYLISLAILIGCFIGMMVIILRKLPILADLAPDIAKPGILDKAKIGANKIKDKFSFEIFLQKFLSKVRILTLKMENKIGTWLGKLRQRMLKKKNSHSDNYWREIKGEEEDKKEKNPPI